MITFLLPLLPESTLIMGKKKFQNFFFLRGAQMNETQIFGSRQDFCMLYHSRLALFDQAF